MPICLLFIERLLNLSFSAQLTFLSVLNASLTRVIYRHIFGQLILTFDTRYYSLFQDGAKRSSSIGSLWAVG